MQTGEKKLRGDAPVRLRIRGRDFQGLAESVVEDKDAIAAGLAALCKKFRMMPGFTV